MKTVSPRGVASQNGNYCTLRIFVSSKWSKSAAFDGLVLQKNVVAGQVNVLPPEATCIAIDLGALRKRIAKYVKE